MSIGNLFYWNYWFSQPATAYGGVLWFWVWFFLVLVLIGLIFKIVRVYRADGAAREVLRRFGNIGLTMGMLGLVWLFLRQQRVSFLAWRFWLVFWLIIAIWWLVKIIIYTIWRAPEIKAANLQRELREKYLPGKKR